MRIKGLLGWAVVAFIVYYVFSDPSAAGGTAHQLLDGLKHAGNSLATFVGSIH